MVEISIEGDKAIFDVEGWHKLFSLRSRLKIPLVHIRSVDIDPQPAMGWFDGLKLAGTNVPNIFRAGIFYQQGNFVFWDVQTPENTIVINLKDEHFAKLIIEVADPQGAARLLKDAISHSPVSTLR